VEDPAENACVTLILSVGSGADIDFRGVAPPTLASIIGFTLFLRLLDTSPSSPASNDFRRPGRFENVVKYWWTLGGAAKSTVLRRVLLSSAALFEKLFAVGATKPNLGKSSSSNLL
jgi:hypothetical protein